VPSRKNGNHEQRKNHTGQIHRIGSSTRHQKLVNIFVSLLSMIFSVSVLEIGLRIYFMHDYSVPNYRNMCFKKTWPDKHVHLNALGHRDNEFAADKPENTFRIVVLGDSLTFGEGVEDVNDLYTEIIETKLNRGQFSYRIEVINTAQCGYNVAEYLRTMKHQGLSYGPDLVMIGFFLNDIEDSKENRPRTEILPGPLHRLLSKVSFVYHYTYYGISSALLGERWDAYTRAYTSPHSHDWKRFALYWEELLTVCRDRGIPAVVIILPCIEHLDDEHEHIDVYDRVASLSIENGAAVMNVFPTLKGRQPKELRVGVTDAHPNKEAHKIYAESIYAFLMENEELIHLEE